MNCRYLRLLSRYCDNELNTDKKIIYGQTHSFLPSLPTGTKRHTLNKRRPPREQD